MRFATVNQISLHDLRAMADGALEDTISDRDFLETLAAQRCFLLSPWVVCAGEQGQLSRVTPMVYTLDGKIDKARLLVAVERVLRRARMAALRAVQPLRFWVTFFDVIGHFFYHS